MTIMEVSKSGQLSLDLSAEEKSTLQRCERIIQEGEATFMKVGGALLTIQEGRLYRATHSSFEAYLDDRWNLGKSAAYRMIQAVKVVDGLSPIGDTLPQAESVARPLGALAPEKRQEAWKDAVESSKGGKVTASTVQQSVNRVLGKPEPAKEVKRDAPSTQATVVRPQSPTDIALHDDRESDDREPVGEEEHDLAWYRAHLDVDPEAAVAAAPVQPPSAARPDTANLLRPMAPAPAAPASAVTPTPAPVVPPVASPASPAPAVAAPASTGAYVTALLPRSEYDWLVSSGLTPATAIAELRELRQQSPDPALQSRTFVLAEDAYEALQFLTTKAFEISNKERSLQEQLEIMILTRASQGGFTKEKD